MSAPDLPGLTRDGDGDPMFPEPWAARALALAVGMSERGAFAWPEFAAALAAARARDPDGDYFAAWLAAFETVLAQQGIAAPAAVDALAEAWVRAARATPHGHPIRLENAR